MRKTLLTVHLALAAFFLPIALMFALTGGLYTLAVKGGYDSTSRAIELAAPLTPELGPLVALVERELAAATIDVPSGSASIKKAGTSFELEWTGVYRDVVLRPTANPLEAELIIKDTGPWRHAVQLHKAKGSDVAKAFSVTWALGLIFVLVSGMAMAWMAPPYRRMAIKASVAGAATFVAYVLIG
jgi:hypothetical protein